MAPSRLLTRARRRADGSTRGRRGVRLAAAGALVLAALAAPLTAVAGPLAAPADAFGTAVAAPLAAAPDDAVPGPVILVGVTGLRWDDVQTLSTPALWDLSRTAAVGTVAARSVSTRSCPADGWLGVSAGARWADLDVPDGTCRTLRSPGESGFVPGWADYLKAAREQPYGARPGLLGRALADAGVTATGIGPGAAIALADADGMPVGPVVARPTRPVDLGTTVRQAIASSRIVVVDAGAVRDPGSATRSRAATSPGESEDDGIELPGEDGSDDPSSVDVIVEPTRAEQVRAIDARIDAVVRASRGTGATVLVVSLADSGRARLQLAAATGPAPGGRVYDQALLTSGSTQQAGVVQATDVTSTVLTLLGLPVPDASASAPLLPTRGPATATDRVALLVDIGIEARQAVRLSSSYLTRLVIAEAVLFVAAGVLLTSRRRADRPPLRPGLQALRVAGLALGAAPVASFLADLVPWWRAGSPTLAFWGAIVGWMAVVTAVALGGPWRRHLLGPAAVVAGVTVVVLCADAVTGSALVIDSPMGAHRIQAARFYGMSNQAFALVTAGSLVLATAVAQALLDRGRRALAVASVVVLGLVVTAINGTPGLGSDFGGPPAILVGFAILAVVVSGRRVSWRTLLLAVGVAAAVVIGFAWLDWLRPAADRTHLGRFFATVVDGGLWQVVARKMSVHLRVLTYWRYLVLALGGTLVTALVLLGPRPLRRRMQGAAGVDGPLSGMTREVPLLRMGSAAIGVALAIGFAINDSGIVIPATGIALAVPCLVAAAAQLRLNGRHDAVAVADGQEVAERAADADDAADRAGAARADGDAAPAEAVSPPRDPDAARG